eukprot:gene31164-8684_t
MAARWRWAGRWERSQLRRAGGGMEDTKVMEEVGD